MGWTTVQPNDKHVDQIVRVLSGVGIARKITFIERNSDTALTIGPEPIVMHTEIIRRVTVKEWPRETMFDWSLLKNADPELMTVNKNEVTITVANGWATYRLAHDEMSLEYLAAPAYLISSRLSED